MNKTLLAIVVVPVTALVIGIPGYVWYAKNVKPIVEAKAAVQRELIDPSSAEFRNVRIDSLRDICGEVNAKNRMGGYGGFTHFQVSTFAGKTIVLLDSETSNIAERLCKVK